MSKTFPIEQSEWMELNAKLTASEKEVEELREKLGIAIKKLEKLRDGPGNRMRGWFATWAHEYAAEALQAIALKGKGE